MPGFICQVWPWYSFTQPAAAWGHPPRLLMILLKIFSVPPSSHFTVQRTAVRCPKWKSWNVGLTLAESRLPLLILSTAFNQKGGSSQAAHWRFIASSWASYGLEIGQMDWKKRQTKTACRFNSLEQIQSCSRSIIPSKAKHVDMWHIRNHTHKKWDARSCLVAPDRPVDLPGVGMGWLDLVGGIPTAIPNWGSQLGFAGSLAALMKKQDPEHPWTWTSKPTSANLLILLWKALPIVDVKSKQLWVYELNDTKCI